MALEKKVEKQLQDHILHEISGMLPESVTFADQHFDTTPVVS